MRTQPARREACEEAGQADPLTDAGASFPIEQILERPASERCREHRYRFGQAVVFGLPVLGLEWFGRGLGGPEAGRWVAILQALLAGWVVYVGAGGLVFEGLMMLMRGRLSGGLVVGGAAGVVYLLSFASVVVLLITRAFWFEPLFFDAVVLLIALWSGAQWFWLSRQGMAQARV